MHLLLLLARSRGKESARSGIRKFTHHQLEVYPPPTRQLPTTNEMYTHHQLRVLRRFSFIMPLLSDCCRFLCIDLDVSRAYVLNRRVDYHTTKVYRRSTEVYTSPTRAYHLAALSFFASLFAFRARACAFLFASIIALWP